MCVLITSHRHSSLLILNKISYMPLMTIKTMYLSSLDSLSKRFRIIPITMLTTKVQMLSQTIMDFYPYISRKNLHMHAHITPLPKASPCLLALRELLSRRTIQKTQICRQGDRVPVHWRFQVLHLALTYSLNTFLLISWYTPYDTLQGTLSQPLSCILSSFYPLTNL